jgi:hypothetical protein
MAGRGVKDFREDILKRRHLGRSRCTRMENAFHVFSTAVLSCTKDNGGIRASRFKSGQGKRRQYSSVDELRLLI